jgi:hypothetical protein
VECLNIEWLGKGSLHSRHRNKECGKRFRRRVLSIDSIESPPSAAEYLSGHASASSTSSTPHRTDDEAQSDAISGKDPQDPGLGASTRMMPVRRAQAVQNQLSLS